MRMSRQSIALIFPLMLAACSSDKVAVEPAKLVDFKPSAKIEACWNVDIGDAELSVLFPAVTREAVFAANAEGDLYRLDRNTGKQVWRINSGFPITGGVGVGDGLVLVGGEKGELAAFNEDTGKLIWQVKVTSDVLSPPKIANGVVVVRTGNQRITGLSAEDGRRLWLYERATPTLIVRSHAGVEIRNGLVYAGFAAGKLAAISLKNGVVVWEASVSQPRGNTELERISDITSLPVVDDAQVCAVAFQGRLACFDAIRGSTLWSRDISSDKGLAFFGNTLYITDTDGNVQALSKGRGSSIWKNSQLLFRKATAPYPLDDFLLIGDFEGYVHALKREDGSFVARHKTDGSAIVISPITLGRNALVQTSDGELYCFAIH